MWKKLINKIKSYQPLEAPECLTYPLLYTTQGSKTVRIDCKMEESDILNNILRQLFFTDVKIIPHERLPEAVSLYVKCPDKESKIDMFTIIHIYSQQNVYMNDFKTNSSLRNGVIRRKKLLSQTEKN
jgi:hypothetical protein